MNDLRAALESGLRHHEAGDPPAAERLYRQVLKAQPNNPDALYLLGVLAQEAGKIDAAVSLFARAIKRNRNNPRFYLALGDARRAQGRLREAAACYRKALAIEPKNAEAHLNLATVRHAQGKLAEAIKHYRRAVSLKPDFAEAHNNLGVALTAKEQRAEAAEHVTRALELRPDYADAHVNLGQALKAQGRLKEAAAAYRKALELDPKLVEAHNNLGNAHGEAGRPEAAIEHYRQALAIRPDYAEAHNNLGVALTNLGRLEEAIAAHEKALELRPRYADAHVGLGAALHILGRTNEAVERYETALAIEPEHARSHHNLAMIRKAHSPADEIAHLESLLANKNLLDKEAMTLRFALGKLCDDAGRFEEAFAHYRVANALRRAELERYGVAFDAAAHERLIDRLIEVFDRPFFEARRDLGERSDLPVFVLGMPRSGTTLVEQILASHSRVFGAGELEDIGRIATRLPATAASNEPYPACAAAIDRKTARRLGRAYLQRLRALAPEAARITDKLPGNFLHLGAIALLLPGARVLHCRRDSLDTCLSCYFQNFHDPMTYSYDLGDLGHYYRQYERIMAHWHDVLRLPMLEVLDVHYEDLVADQEAVSRELVAFCGLGWEEACLKFHETARAVRTASLTQVRQPIYRSSLGRWRNYEAHLGPLRAALGR